MGTCFPTCSEGMYGHLSYLVVGYPGKDLYWGGRAAGSACLPQLSYSHNTDASVKIKDNNLTIYFICKFLSSRIFSRIILLSRALTVIKYAGKPYSIRSIITKKKYSMREWLDRPAVFCKMHKRILFYRTRMKEHVQTLSTSSNVIYS